MRYYLFFDHHRQTGVPEGVSCRVATSAKQAGDVVFEARASHCCRRWRQRRSGTAFFAHSRLYFQYLLKLARIAFTHARWKTRVSHCCRRWRQRRSGIALRFHIVLARIAFRHARWRHTAKHCCRRSVTHTRTHTHSLFQILYYLSLSLFAYVFNIISLFAYAFNIISLFARRSLSLRTFRRPAALWRGRCRSCTPKCAPWSRPWAQPLAA